MNETTANLIIYRSKVDDKSHARELAQRLAGDGVTVEERKHDTDGHQIAFDVVFEEDSDE